VEARRTGGKVRGRGWRGRREREVIRVARRVAGRGFSGKVWGLVEGWWWG